MKTPKINVWVSPLKPIVARGRKLKGRWFVEDCALSLVGKVATLQREFNEGLLKIKPMHGEPLGVVVFMDIKRKLILK